MNFKTEQEKFWAGEFGDSYINRNLDDKLLASNIALFSRILSRCNNEIDSIIEFGSNIGLNLSAIKALFPKVDDISAIEINKSAVEELQKRINLKKIYNQSILDFDIDYQRDFVFIKGVLIHINPEYLSLVYDKLYATSKKYICIAEYYNPVPVEVTYRGNTDRLFKRDFAGEMLKRFPDLKLIDYGFVYHGDPVFPDDDITYFLLEK